MTPPDSKTTKQQPTRRKISIAQRRRTLYQTNERLLEDRRKLVEALRDWEQSMGIMVRRPPICDPGFTAIYQNMQRILAEFAERGS